MSSEGHKVKLGDIVDIFTGYPFKSAEYSENPNDIKLIRGDNIAQGTLRWDGVKRWPIDKAEGLDNFLLKENDVLLAMDRPWIPAGLKFARVYSSDLPCLLVQRVACLRAKSGQDQNFIYSLLSTPAFSEYIQNVTTGTAVPHISVKQIKEFELEKLSLETEKEVGFIHEIFESRIKLLRETNTTLEKIAQALFKSWFVDFDPVHANAGNQAPSLPPEIQALFPATFTDTPQGPIPEGWEVKPLDEAAHFLNGLALQKFPATGNEFLPVIKIAQLRKGDTSGADRASRELKPEYIIQNGDVLFSWSGSLEVTIWCGGEGALNQHLFKVTSDKFPKWFYLLWTKYHLPNFQQIAASKATTMGHIQRKHLTEALVLIPPSDVLSAADDVFTPLIDEFINNSLQASNLAALRDALLPRLISGQLRLPEVEQAVAAITD